MRASYRWRVLGSVDFTKLCPNGHQCVKFTICIFSKAMIRFFHFWFGVFSIFEKAILLQKIYVKFTVEKSFVMGYLKNISSGGYDFEARLRKDYQHLNFAFPQIRMNLCVLVTVGTFWDRLISLNYACPNDTSASIRNPACGFRL